MADEFKAPIPTVELDQDADQQPAPAPAPASAADPAPAPAPAATSPNAEPFSASKTAGRVSSWFKRTFPGQENAVIFGIIGLIAAILLFAVGIWRALIITLFVVVGVAIGQTIDGDPKILRAVQRFISDRRQ